MPRTHSQFVTEQPAGLAARKLIAAAVGPAVAVIVAGHDHDRLLARPGNTRSAATASGRASCCRIRLASRRCCSSAWGIATLFKSTQSAWGSHGRYVAVVQVVRADRRRHRPAPDRPERIALARVDDGGGQVVGEGGRLSAVAAHAAQRDAPGWHVGGQWSHSCRGWPGSTAPFSGVAIGGAVELHGLADDAVAGRASRCRPGGNLRTAWPRLAVSPSRPASCGSGRMAIRLPPAVTQSVSMVTCAATGRWAPESRRRSRPGRSPSPLRCP